MTRQVGGQGGRKIFIYAAAGVVILVAAAAGLYLWRGRAISASARPLESLTIATTAYPGTCPILVGQEKGYFENEGLRVAIQLYTTGRAAMDATLQGKASLGTSADLPIMFAGLENLPVLVVGTISTIDTDHGIVARGDRGISAPENLKGKRIGVTLTTSGHFALDAFLNRYKLAPTDIVKVPLKPEDMTAAMAKGQIDAASTWEPHLDALRAQLGASAVSFSYEGVYESVYNLSGARNYVLSHPDTVKKVLRALVRAGRFCEESPVAAREITAQKIGADAAKLKDLWPIYRFRLTLDQSLLLALEDEARWAMKNKLTDRADMPNYLSQMYLDGLQTVTPAAITVIH